MQVTVKLKHLRIAPRKVRLVTDLIRGKKASEAKTLLNFILKRGAKPLQKLLETGIAAAKNDFQVNEENLRISEIKVDEGPKLKRWRARARGQAYQIQKKTSHISLTLEGADTKKKEATKEATTIRQKETKTKRAFAEPKKPSKEIKPISLKPKKGGWKKIFRRKAF